jgi:uncharacterized protein (TIGR00255 family)
MSVVVSMTGFASVDGALAGGRTFCLSIKSVNHRHLDLSVRLPGALDALEAPLRKVVKSSVRRGHVELTLLLEKASATSVVEVDHKLLEAYVGAFRRAAEKLGLAQDPDLNGLLKMPGVVSATLLSLDVQEMEEPVLAATKVLVERFQAARRLEGESLVVELRAGMTRVAALADEARTLRVGVAAAELAKLSTRIKELMSGTDVSQDRLLTEAALLASRSDVEEELVRLRTHIERFVEILDGGGEVGRQLDFLLQELNREANTMLSKTGANSGDGGLRLTEIGLAIKVELERAREQVQNLE